MIDYDALKKNGPTKLFVSDIFQVEMFNVTSYYPERKQHLTIT